MESAARTRVRSWLSASGHSQVWLARQLDVYPPRVCEWLKGGRRLTVEAADRLVAVSGGIVTLREILLESRPKRRGARSRR